MEEVVGSETATDDHMGLCQHLGDGLQRQIEGGKLTLEGRKLGNHAETAERNREGRHFERKEERKDVGSVGSVGRKDGGGTQPFTIRSRRIVNFSPLVIAGLYLSFPKVLHVHIGKHHICLCVKPYRGRAKHVFAHLYTYVLSIFPVRSRFTLILSHPLHEYFQAAKSFLSP